MEVKASFAQGDCGEAEQALYKLQRQQEEIDMQEKLTF
jgi:hypothetical protein